MDSIARNDKAHIVCVPYQAQSHVDATLKPAKLLHHNNFHITFVNTEYNHIRLLKSRCPNTLDGLPDFQFKTIIDELSASGANATQHVPSLSISTSKLSLAPFLELISQLNSNDDLPPVTCIVADSCMTFTFDDADKLGIPEVLFWTASACGALAYAQFQTLLEKGLTPLKDASYLTNGYLEISIDWITVMKSIWMKDLLSLCKTIDKNDIMFNFLTREISRSTRASALILNTFGTFEQDVLDALALIFPLIYTIGPLQLLVD